MSKLNKINWKSDAAIYTYIVITILIISIFSTIDAFPTDIDYKYDGLLYQGGNEDNFEIIEIEIKGEYTNKFFEKNSVFEGVIKIGDIIFTAEEIPIVFGESGVGSLENEVFGFLYQSNGFESLTITISEEKSFIEGYNFDGKSDWLISAPCQTREEAVEISNELIRKRLGDSFSVE